MRRFGIDVLLWLAYAVPILILWQQKKLPWWLSVAALLLLFAWARTIRTGTSLSHAPYGKAWYAGYSVRICGKGVPGYGRD